MSAFTPGPWRIRSKRDDDKPDRYNLRVTADCEGGETLICEGIGFDGVPQCDADAALIANAPDLLAALEAVMEQLDEVNVSVPAALSARAAIAKARGEAS